MKVKVQTRIDIDALRDIAGDKTLVCGQVYHRDGMAEILWILQERKVVGTKPSKFLAIAMSYNS